MKKDLIKPGSPRQQLLVDLARKINAREDTIEGLSGKLSECKNAFLRECLLQGQQLLEAKAALTHGAWQHWLKAHCPLIKYDSASAYMRLATNFSSAKDLDDLTSLRAALFVCAARSAAARGETVSEKESARSWPYWLDAISRFGKALGVISKHPLDEWPIEGLQKLREDLRPLAKELWPEANLQ